MNADRPVLGGLAELQMDPSIFGLDGHPFETEFPRPDDTALFEAQAPLLAELRAGLKTPQGIAVLVGESGAGKSALVIGLAERLGDDTLLAYLPESGPGLRGILAEAIQQLSTSGGTAVASGSGDKYITGAIRDLAKANAASGKNTLIIVDNAHELPAKTIERFARLFPQDPAQPSKLHLLLVGRPELLDRLNAAGDRSVLRYLVQVCRMDGIGPEDSFRYIAERIGRVGGTVEKLFSEEALGIIVQQAGGLPARINALCRSALENAAAGGARKVDAAAVSDSREHTDGGASDFTIEEHGEEAAAHTLGQGPTPTAQDPKQPPQPHAAIYGANRKSMGLWAAGLIALVVGFVAALSSGENDGNGAVVGATTAVPVAVVVGTNEHASPPANPPTIAKLALVRTPAEKVREEVAPLAKPVTPTKVAPGPLASAIDDLKEHVARPFSVQVGAFRTEANAARIVARLSAAGVKGAHVIANHRGIASVYRVFSGNFVSESQAHRHAKLLKAKGYPTYVRKLQP